VESEGLAYALGLLSDSEKALFQNTGLALAAQRLGSASFSRMFTLCLFFQALADHGEPLWYGASELVDG
jgi:hypothetical protein